MKSFFCMVVVCFYAMPTKGITFLGPLAREEAIWQVIVFTRINVFMPHKDVCSFDEVVMLCTKNDLSDQYMMRYSLLYVFVVASVIVLTAAFRNSG